MQMVETERGEDGRYQAAVSDEEIITAVEENAPAGTSEVAEAVGMTRQGADRRLRQLREGGRVNSKKLTRTLVWYIGDE